MSQKKDILAWIRKPEPEGTLFYSGNLNDESVVGELFLHCKADKGYLTAEGWKFLFSNFGKMKLQEWQEKTGWVEDGLPGLKSLFQKALFSGYNPVTDELGDYDRESDIFISLDGISRKVEWNDIIHD